MSKLAVLRQYQTSPAAGGIFSFLAPVAKFIGKGLGIIKPAVTKAVASPTGKAVLTAAGTGAAMSLLSKGGGGSSGASGTWRRRSRGITARELRGYRKVARLLHNEGMVSRRARGRH